ncbi:MAG: OmpA family protein [Deltaproteobacteria bacterium]|nr:OmpA family protein [Deltaproteobacteria bacterium]
MSRHLIALRLAFAFALAGAVLLRAGPLQASPDRFGLGDGHFGSLVVDPPGLRMNLHRALTAPLSAGERAVAVRDSSGFDPGDLILIIETAGALTPATSGTQGPFDLSRADPGRYELARIERAEPSRLILTASITRSFASPGSQVLFVPELTELVVRPGAAFVADPWDGDSGGILALLVSGAIVNDGIIDASGAGARGGAIAAQTLATSGCGGLDRAAPEGAQKGEGVVADTFGAASTGRGNRGNGGGGGVCRASGGAGGGNGGRGGSGGRSASNDGERAVGGMRGAALTYSLLERLTFGGGGGAGARALGDGSSGGPGGGIVWIRAGSLSGNGDILARGESADPGTRDGQGGGGAGGSILLRSAGAVDCREISAVGGAGNSATDSAVAAGPGGGGGGGRLLIQARALDASCALRVGGGSAGTTSGPSSYAPNHGANPGDPGVVEVAPAGGFVVPAPPSITEPIGGAVTASRPLVRGRAHAGFTVIVLADRQEVARTITASDGSFHVVTTTLSHGVHNLEAIERFLDVESSESAAVEIVVAPPMRCGDGAIDPGEACDDGNQSDHDGCSGGCSIEAGWICSGEPSTCTPIPRPDGGVSGDPEPDQDATADAGAALDSGGSEDAEGPAPSDAALASDAGASADAAPARPDAELPGADACEEDPTTHCEAPTLLFPSGAHVSGGSATGCHCVQTPETTTLGWIWIASLMGLALAGRRARLSRILFPVLVALTAASAMAQETGDLPVNRLRPAATRDGLLDVEWAGIASDRWLDISVFTGYARAPLTVTDDLTGERAGDLVAGRWSLYLAASFRLDRILEVSAGAEMVLAQGRSDRLVFGDTELILPPGAESGLGDVWLAAKLAVLTTQKHGVDLAILPRLTIPTAGASGYRGDTGFTFVPELALSRRLGILRIAFNGGAQLRPRSAALQDLFVSHEITYRGALGLRPIPWFEIDSGLSGSTAVGAAGQGASPSPLELLLGVRFFVARPVELSLAGGLGLNSGWGTPDFRAIAGIRFSALSASDPKPPPAKKPKTSKVVPTDRDHDRVRDADDRCPEHAEDRDGFEDEDGCPELDNDRDGVSDAADHCPIEAGPVGNEGCPESDQDGDGIADRVDSCPTEPGVREHQGCQAPIRVAITEEKLEISDRFYFRTGSAELDPRSKTLLDEIAKVLDAHREIASVRIEGHTDDRGSASGNRRLSARRAEAVRQALAARGVDAARLEAQGFGPDRPLGSNATAAGRSKNRRVELVILERR